MKRLVLLVSALLWSGTVLAAGAAFMPGDINGWAFPASAMTDHGAYSQYGWTSDGTASKEFKLTTDAGYTTEWAGGVACTNEVVNSLAQNGANASFAAVGVGTYLTFNSKANGGNMDLAIWETAAQPVGLTTVSEPAAKVEPGNATTITVTAATVLPAAEQYAYVRWTNDGWGSSAVVAAPQFAGNQYRADIPAQAAGATVEYYAFTSKKADAADFGSLDPDLGTLSLANDTGANYTFTVFDIADAFHEPGTAVPTAANMVNPAAPTTDDNTLSIYCSNRFQNGTANKDMSAMVLHYRIGVASWTTSAGAWFVDSGDDKFWVADIDISAVGANTTISYYIETQFTDTADGDKTYLYNDGSDNNAKAGTDAPAIASPWTVTVAGNLGTGFHTPSAVEPGGVTMRNALVPDVSTDSAVTVWFAETDLAVDDDDPIGQVKLFYRFGSDAFAQHPTVGITPAVEENDKDYFSWDIDLTGQLGGAQLQYYFFATYKPTPGYDPTYYHWSGGASTAADNSVAAAAAPYEVVLAGPAIPTLGEWAMIIALFLMAGLAFRELRRRGSSQHMA